MSATRAPLPPFGPAWFPAAMGTGILATLLQLAAPRFPATAPLAVAMLVVAWVVLTTLVVGYGRRIADDRAALTSTLRDPGQLPMWGTVSMGLLAVGSATATVVPATPVAVANPALTQLAWGVDGVLWVTGTLVGLLAAAAFTLRLLTSDCGAPTTVWGLAVVGPMVSATTGAALVPHVGATTGVWLLAVTLLCFFVSFVLGVVIFAVAYHHHWRVAPVALAASCSTWIPLGMVGQSTAAAQALAERAAALATPAAGTTIHAIANTYGVVMLTLGAPLVAWAVVITARGFLGRMPFVPGWWALTFPIGTLALGATNLGKGLGSPGLADLGLVLTAVLCGTVTLCLVATVRAILRAHNAGSATPVVPAPSLRPALAVEETRVLAER